MATLVFPEPASSSSSSSSSFTRSFGTASGFGPCSDPKISSTRTREARSPAPNRKPKRPAPTQQRFAPARNSKPSNALILLSLSLCIYIAFGFGVREREFKGEDRGVVVVERNTESEEGDGVDLWSETVAFCLEWTHELYGFAYSGPFGHFLYKLMDKIFKGEKGNDTVAKKKEAPQFAELEWLTDVGIFGEQFAQEALAAAEVPQLLVTHNNSSVASNRTSKSYISHKKPRIEVLNDQDDDDEFSIFIVPDLG
ncbi:B-box zinc finger protein 24 [Glycine soja]|uniref:B-box zinc finger protein 24 n=1 Tax=Glycine soja TaxID=3848 RepID=A0A445LRW4_GLYSO|nr:B-box zinc finger protein 24 [Glycine soja]